MRISGLFALAILSPVFALGAALVNINTADATLLDTLPGIGPSKATAIVDYRNINGPFVHVEDIQNVSGIGPSTYAGLAPFIIIGDTGSSDTASAGESETSSSTPLIATSTNITASPSSSGGPAEYLLIPTLRIITGDDRTVSSGADTAFTAVVYDGKGNKRDDAAVVWTFGDGMQRTGASVFHPYYYSGEYIAVVRATTADGGDASVESIITVKDASIKIASVSSRGITLVNSDSRTLDLSLWRLSTGGKEFKIPLDTQILAGRTTLFPSQVIELPVTGSALLLYPSGETAYAYPAIQQINLQPSSQQISFNKVQAVEPKIISTKADIQTYEEAVIAPTATTELAAVGAALAPESPVLASRATGIFHSPWVLGLLGVLVAAGGAFILL